MHIHTCMYKLGKIYQGAWSNSTETNINFKRKMNFWKDTGYISELTEKMRTRLRKYK